MHSDVAISVKNLAKTYRIFGHPGDRIKQALTFGQKQYHKEFTALKDVSFEIKKGETVGIIGRNGSGKSTLLQLICGIMKPTLGSVEVNGRISALLELGAGFNPEFTGRENVYFQGAVIGITKEEMDSIFDEIEVFADISEFIDQPVRTYSSGMFVRLAFSVAIHVKPKILIVDEALSVGDAGFQARCIKKLEQLRQSGTTILLVSHDINSIRSLCDSVIWFEKGLVKIVGDVFQVTGYYMENLFSIKKHISNRLDSLNEISFKKNMQHPVMHWGEKPGLIQSAGVYGRDGSRKDLINWNEEIEVRITFSLPEKSNMAMIAASFSIKNLRGIDLIVSIVLVSQCQYKNVERNLLSASFRFRNPLAPGNYLLIAAIEDHSALPVVSYYEYIEGIQYFTSQSDEPFFGVCQPEIFQELSVINS